MNLEEELERVKGTLAATIALNENMVENLLLNGYYDREDPVIQAAQQFIDLLKNDLEPLL